MFADAEAEARDKANRNMPSFEASTTQLSQPWKGWYKAETNLNFSPLHTPVSLGLGGQGNRPQKARQVDLSKESTAPADSKS